jgi:4-amino-4-deoxy-L-arabinose transferase-like glycosyltransferase
VSSSPAMPRDASAKSLKIAYGCIVLIAFTVRLLAAFWWQNLATQEGRVFRFGDSASYWHLGEAIAHGAPYQYGGIDGSVFRAPGYPLLLSCFASIEPKDSAVWDARLAGCLLGTLTVALIMRIAFTLGGAGTAILSGLTAALYPGGVGMSVTILSEALFMPLMMLHLLLLTRAFSSCDCLPSPTASRHPLRQWMDGAHWAILAGVIGGAAILTRPSWLLFPPLAALIHWLTLRNRKAFCTTIFVGLGIILCMAPWWYRNWCVTDRFVLTTLQVGPSLYDGLHEGASGGSDEGMAFVGTFAEQLRRQEAQQSQLLSGTFEYRLNREMQRAAMRWAYEHPTESAKLAINKFWRTWNPWPPAQELSSFWVRFSETLGCFTILTCASLGAWRLRNRWREFYLYLLPIPYFTLLHMIFVGSVRYRQPAIMSISVLAGIAIMWILSKLLFRKQIPKQ